MAPSDVLKLFACESEVEYRAKAKTYLTSHQLGDFRKCPSLYFKKKEGLVEDEDRPAYLVGHAAHTLILEGRDQFEQDYAVGGPINPKTGACFGPNTKAFADWRKVVEALDTLRTRQGMAVILIAHAKVEKFEDPETFTYDRYSPRLHKHACALVTEWCDAVLFATRKFRTEKEEQGFGKERTIAKEVGKDGGERILRCVGSPACVAKNRYGLPADVTLSWEALAAQLFKA
jgi:hypothetical protein